MPTIPQLPAAIPPSPDDVLPVSQAGKTCRLAVGSLLAGTQPALTLAPGTLLGRTSPTVGGPEALGLGPGLSVEGGVLTVSGVAGPPGPQGPAGPPGPAGPAGPVGATPNIPAAALLGGSGGNLVPVSVGTGLIMSGGSLGTGDLSGSAVLMPGASTPLTLAQHLGVELRPESFGAAGDGVTDDTAALNAAIAAASASGGGVVRLTRRYLADSGNLNVLENVHLAGRPWTGGKRANGDYSAMPSCIVLNPSFTIQLQRNSSLYGLNIMRKGMLAPQTYRDALAQTAAFAGIAITQADDDVLIEKCFVLGFATAFSVSGHARAQVRSLSGDCTNGVYADNVHDISRFHNCEFWPFVTGNRSFSITSWNIMNVADNGSGQVRITTGAPHTLVSGDSITIQGVNGVSGVNTLWPVTVIDSSTLDLQGSSFSGTYAGGGTIYVNTNRRAGVGFTCTNSEAVEFVNCFAFGFDTGFHLGAGAYGVQMHNCSTDNNYTTAWPGIVGLQLDGDANNTSVNGGYFVGPISILCNTNNPIQAHRIYGASLMGASSGGVPGYNLRMLQGRLVASACTFQGTGPIWVGDATQALVLAGNDGPVAPIQFQSSAGASKVTISSTVLPDTSGASLRGPTAELWTADTVNGGFLPRIVANSDGSVSIHRRSSGIGGRITVHDQNDAPAYFMSVGPGAGAAWSIGGDPGNNPNGSLAFGSSANMTQPLSISYKRASNTPLNGDVLANVDFVGRNSSNADTAFARLTATSNSVTAGSEIGSFSIQVKGSTGLVSALTLNGQGQIVNPALVGAVLDVTSSGTTPALADNSTKIATTAWVKAQNYLTSAPVQSVNGQTGAVTIPTYTLPPATATTLGGVMVGSGLTVAANGSVAVNFGSTAGTVAAGNDSRITGAAPLNSPAFTGAPTAPTPTQGDNSQAIATTAWVTSRGLALNPQRWSYSAATTLSSSQCGGIVYLSGSGNFTVTLPPAASVQGGTTLTLSNIATGSVTVALTVPDGNDEVGSIILQPGERIAFVSNGTTYWHTLFRCNMASPMFSGSVSAGGSFTNQVVLGGGATGSPISLKAIGSDTNIGLSLVPKGSGAITAAVPDGTAIGGAARGANAVDLQTSRSAAGQVASGVASAIVGGSGVTASGNYAVAGGQNCAATGTGSVAFGVSNSAAGAGGAIPGGSGANDRGRFGSLLFASGSFATAGDAQIGSHVLRATVTGATPTRMTADGATASAINSIPLPNNSAYLLAIRVVARNTSSGDAAVWSLPAALITRGASAATTAIAGSPAFTLGGATSGATGWAAPTLGADTTNGAMSLIAPGQSGATIRYVAEIETVEVT